MEETREERSRRCGAIRAVEVAALGRRRRRINRARWDSHGLLTSNQGLRANKPPSKWGLTTSIMMKVPLDAMKNSYEEAVTHSKFLKATTCSNTVTCHYHQKRSLHGTFLPPSGATTTRTTRAWCPQHRVSSRTTTTVGGGNGDNDQRRLLHGSSNSNAKPIGLSSSLRFMSPAPSHDTAWTHPSIHHVHLLLVAIRGPCQGKEGEEREEEDEQKRWEETEGMFGWGILREYHKSN
uniref:Uncharacterized protein n=1 Tax=Oryza punctata TaxID=4537 RepID=A0A0E0KRB0_ORYPU